MVAQFVGLERRTSRMGRDAVDHAPGAYDDIANAVAGALITKADAPMNITQEILDMARDPKWRVVHHAAPGEYVQRTGSFFGSGRYFGGQ
jgi:hypothetical protein